MKKSLIVALTALLLLIVVVFFFFHEDDKTLISDERLYPVKWTEAVELDDIGDIEEVFLQPVDFGENCPGCELVMAKDLDRVVVETCDDFFYYTQQDYYPPSTYEMRMEATFIRQCEPLKYLQQAKASTESYLVNLDLRSDPVELCLEIFGEIEEGVLGPNCREMRLEEETASSTQINLIHERKGESEENEDSLISRLTVEVLGQGDFDHDGVEDALLYIHYISYEGSWPGVNFVDILKKDKDGVISVSK